MNSQGYLEEITVPQSGQQEVLGDSIAWGGCTIIYLLGQQLHFELFDFSYQVLNVSEVETVSASHTHRNPQVLQVEFCLLHPLINHILLLCLNVFCVCC